MQTVIIALGSNKPHGRHGAPPNVVRAAIDVLAERGLRPLRLSRIHPTPPLGPSDRTFANAVLIAETSLDPPALLAVLKSVERSFGRRRGRAWGARILDLDLIAWGNAVWPDLHRWRHAPRGLAVPHRAMHGRAFVLDPLIEVAADWRHPILNRTARHLHAQLHRPRPVD